MISSRSSCAIGMGLVLVFVFLCDVSIAEDVATREDRAALFDYLLAKTMERESFSPVKNQALDLDVNREMLRFKEELLSADSDEKLYYALVKISNARKDRHLSVDLVEGGISLDGYMDEPKHAPIRFFTDYSEAGKYFFFVGDYAENIVEYSRGKSPEVGDKLVAINDRSIDDYVKGIEPYHRYSTVNGLWWKLALWIPQKSHIFPPEFFRENVAYTLESDDGERYRLELPYLAPDRIDWCGHGERKYAGFSLAYSTETYDLYRPDDDKSVLIIVWHGFRAHLVEDMDRLMDYAVEHQLLNHAIIWDGTRSRGGSKGAYAVERLSPKPFKTTFGNLRLSDVTPLFIEQKRKEFEERAVLDSGVGETLDDGAWLMDWLEDDVTKGIRDGQAYSNNVPFKLAHLPKHSDGIIKPADVHFLGPMVCLLGPHGGSHLDQFVSIVIDNGLAHTLGMPAGGYSNTWEWEEILTFPISKKPIVRYMWSIGHTIRPNGEILEGNPAEVDEYLPLTRDNYTNYYQLLLSRALKHLVLE